MGFNPRSLNLSTQPALSLWACRYLAESGDWHWSLCQILSTLFSHAFVVLPLRVQSSLLSLPMQGFLVCRSFCFTAPSLSVRPIPFSLFLYFLVPFPYHFMWCLVCLFQTLRAYAGVQQMFCRSCSTWRCTFYVIGRKMMFKSYSSTIFNSSLDTVL